MGMHLLLFKVGRTLYLFKADGKLYKRNRNGFVKVLGNTYYVLKSGELRTGWIGLGNSIYYADSGAGFSEMLHERG